MSKKPDNVSDDAGILPYGSNVGAPSIVLPDTDLFKTERGGNASNYLNEKLEEIKHQYEELKKLAEDTSIVYNAHYNFIPKVGKVYHLYYTGEKYTLSLIENWDRFEFVGSFRFTSDNVWERVVE